MTANRTKKRSNKTSAAAKRQKTKKGVTKGSSNSSLIARQKYVEHRLKPLHNKAFRNGEHEELVLITPRTAHVIAYHARGSVKSALAAADAKHQIRIAKKSGMPVEAKKKGTQKRLHLEKMQEMKGRYKGTATKLMVGINDRNEKLLYSITTKK